MGTPTSSPRPLARELLAGGLALGLALIGLGVWWLRRPEEAEGEKDVTAHASLDFQALVAQMAALDEAHARGEIGEEVYRRRRDILRQQARAALASEQGTRS